MRNRIKLVALLCGAILAFVRVQASADEVQQDAVLVKGARAMALRFSKLPVGVKPGVFVDVVFEEEKPVKSRIVLLQVKVIAVDMSVAGAAGPRLITVQVTPVQAKVLATLQSEGDHTIEVRPEKQKK